MSSQSIIAHCKLIITSVNLIPNYVAKIEKDPHGTNLVHLLSCACTCMHRMNFHEVLGGDWCTPTVHE